MHKFVVAFAAVAGMTMAACAAQAAPRVTLPGPGVSAAVIPAYYHDDWRAREWRRHQEWERRHRHEEWLRHHHHGW